MNPETDKVSFIPLGDGRTLEVRQPGAIRPDSATDSSNWRFTYDAYKRYEQHLTTAASNWPQETAFSVPDGLSPNTFIRCFREARVALLRHDYNTPLAAQHRPLEHSAVISLDPDGKRVWFRAAGTRGRPSRASKATVEAIRRPLFDLEAVQNLPDPGELHAMCVLMSTARISGPFHFHGRFTQETIDSTSTLFDVAFAYDELTDITTLI